MPITSDILSLLLSGIIGSVVGVLGGAWYLNKANAADALSKAAEKLIKPLSDRITVLEGELKTVKIENNSLKVDNAKLANTVAGNQIELGNLRRESLLNNELNQKNNIEIAKLRRENAALWDDNNILRARLKMPPAVRLAYD